MNILILSCSLSPRSRSRIMAEDAVHQFTELGASPALIDLRNHPLPMCDGEKCDPDLLAPLREPIAAADAIILAAPIYNYDVNAAAKNLVEHTGSAWRDKLVGFLCAAGGHGSYMSVMSLANSLMLDFRCLIVPRFVYATRDAFAGGRITSPKISERIAQLCDTTLRLARALNAQTAEPAWQSTSG